MNILEARRRLLDGEIKKRTAEGENISVRSVSRMKPDLTLYGKSEQRTTTGAQLLDFSKASGVDDNAYIQISDIGVSFEYSEQDENSRFITFPCELKAGQSYICTAERSSSDITLYLSQITQYLAFGNPFVPEQDVDSITIYVNASAPKGIYKVDYIMLNTGSSALPWEPYTGGALSPSPSYPQEIKSVGDSGTINVTLSDGGSQSQTLPIQTLNGLPGIPVSSGGNYTDADGQQWICDEVNFKRGVYVQRVSQVEFDGSPDENWTISNYNGGGEKQGLINFQITKPDKRIPNYWVRYNGLLCNMFKGSNGGNVAWEYSFGEGITTDANDIFCVANRSFVASIDEWKNHLTTYPLKLMYPVATPVETPLSASELAAYAALRTYSPTTVVSNDAGAWMKLGYKTKKSLEVTD